MKSRSRAPGGASRFTSTQGIPVFVEASHGLPLVDVQITLRSGSLHDPVEQEGLTRMTWRMVRMGTRGRRESEVEEAISRLGARMSFHIGTTYVQIHGAVIRRNLEPFVALLGEILGAPAFRGADLAQVKRETREDLLSLRDNDRALVARAFRGHLFGDHPYGRSGLGTSRSVSSIDRTSVAAHFKSHFVRSNMLVGFSGDVEPDDVRILMGRYLGDLPSGRAPGMRITTPKIKKGRRVLIVDKPERTQTQLCIGTLGTHIGDPLFDPLLVANTAFGGTFTSRLTQEVREKRGYSYGAHSRLSADRKRDAWYMRTFPSTKYAVDCAQLELDLLEGLVDKGVGAAEHRFAKDYLLKSHCFEIDTAFKRLEPRIDEVLFGLEEGHHARFTQRIRSVKRAASNLALKSRLSSRDVSIVVVATASDVAKGFEGLSGVQSVEVVSHDEL